MSSGLLFQQGIVPNAIYLFKHALVQDAAYGTLLREPRRALHATIAEALEDKFPEIMQTQPELLARHFTEAGMTEKAAGLWGKAGRQSLARSALVEGIEQLNRALGQLTTLSSTPELRSEQINLQVALISPLMHVKGYSAPETKAAVERARLLIEKAEDLGEHLTDQLLLFSVLYGSWVANYITMNGDELRALATQFQTIAEKQGGTVPLMIGQRIMGISLLCTGDIPQARTQFDRALALYDPIEHRPLAMRFGHDNKVAVLSYRAWTLWYLGYPEAALADSDHAVKDAREIGQAATLMYALYHALWPYVCCGNYVAAHALVDELLALADSKAASFWKAQATLYKGLLAGLNGKAYDAVQMSTAGLAIYRSTGATSFVPTHLAFLTRAYAELFQFDNAWLSISEALTAIKISKERWCEAEVNRLAGETTLMCPDPDVTKAEDYFDRALWVAREQQAKSWELRAAMSLARLWRDQGKPRQAHDLLAPVYGWFTEGFDTLDLKEAKALLDDLVS